MKKTILIAIFFSFQIAHCQQQDLFDTKWYATEMVVGGNTIPIPVLPANQPQGCFVGIEIYSGGNNEGAIDLALCAACQAYIVSITNSTFVSLEFICLLCMDCGPCDPDGASTICSQGYLSAFEYNQNAFFDEYQGTYNYTITPLPDNHYELKIDKPNGDYIIYSTESTLSLQENEILEFSIVPNPASSTLTLTGLKSELKSVVIYTLIGNKFPIALEGNNYDVSHLAAGLYFISVTSLDGQKAVQKFIKK